MMNNQEGQVRIAGFQFARELSESEVVATGGAGPLYLDYTPTGEPESDCDPA